MRRRLRSATRAVGGGLKKAAQAATSKAVLGAAQSALQATGPWGSAASAALGGLGSAVRGGNLKQIGMAAARGATPAALRSATGLSRLPGGKRKLARELARRARDLTPQGPARAGFDAARQLLESGVSEARVRDMRRRMRGEAARGFDLAVGTVAAAAEGAEPGRAPRPLSRRVPRLVRDVGAPPMQLAGERGSVALVRNQLERSPELGRGTEAQIASRLGASRLTVRRALASRRLRHRSLSPSAAAFVGRLSGAPLLALGETAGLTPDRKTYVVEDGDYPAKIARALVGDASRWPELVRANVPPKTRAKNGNFTSLYAGERLIVPSSWLADMGADVPSGDRPSSPPADVAAIVQAKALLVAWSKSDGRSAAGLTDYGARPEDAQPKWTSRDRFMLGSFAEWSNRARNTSLATDGELSAAHLEALRGWAESRVTTPPVLPSLPDRPPVSLPPVPPGLPPVPSVPSVPSSKPGTIAVPSVPVPTGGRTAPGTPRPSQRPELTQDADPTPRSERKPSPKPPPKKEEATDLGAALVAAAAIGSYFLL